MQNKFTFVLSSEQSSNFRVMATALGYHGESKVIGKEYFMRQAAILFGLAKATTDPRFQPLWSIKPLTSNLDLMNLGRQIPHH
jgi:hypothetical protein